MRRGGWADLWVRAYWPLIAVSVFVVLGTIAIFVIGGLVQDVRDAQRVNDQQTQAILTQTGEIEKGSIANRRTVCAIAKAITANPIVRYPQFETEAEFQRRIAALRQILGLSHNIDCNAVLAPITVGPTAPKLFPGGDAQSPTTGSQLPGDISPLPRKSRTVHAQRRHHRLSRPVTAISASATRCCHHAFGISRSV